MSLLVSGLGIRDKRMQDALELILSQQTEEGKWLLEDTHNGRFHVSTETKGKSSKWVTANALRALKRFHG
jgi:hypothetical protein